jgi:lycopene cyclase domain-containing protein
MSQSLELANFSYLAMLLFTVFSSWWLEFAFKIKVLRRPRKLLLSILPVSAFFLVWDAFAIHQKHWTFDSDQILGFYGPLDIPIEEFAFFIIIPIAAILTLEGVKVILQRIKR